MSRQFGATSTQLNRREFACTGSGTHKRQHTVPWQGLTLDAVLVDDPAHGPKVCH